MVKDLYGRDCRPFPFPAGKDKNVTVKTDPKCPSCGKLFTAGTFWQGANFCRGLFLLSMIADRPGLSAWELSDLAGMSMQDAQRGLTKLRSWDVVEYAPEPRSDGDSFRYRFTPLPDHEDQYARFLAATQRVERG